MNCTWYIKHGLWTALAWKSLYEHWIITALWLNTWINGYLLYSSYKHSETASVFVNKDDVGSQLNSSDLHYTDIFDIQIMNRTFQSTIQPVMNPVYYVFEDEMILLSKIMKKACKFLATSLQVLKALTCRINNRKVGESEIHMLLLTVSLN